MLTKMKNLPHILTNRNVDKCCKIPALVVSHARSQLYESKQLSGDLVRFPFVLEGYLSTTRKRALFTMKAIGNITE